MKSLTAFRLCSRCSSFPTLGIHLTFKCEILTNRFGVGLTEKECVDLMVRMRDEAFKSWRTGAYDMLQRALGTA